MKKKTSLIGITALILAATPLKAENDLLKIFDKINGGEKTHESNDKDYRRDSVTRVEKLPRGIAIRCKIVNQVNRTGDTILAFVINDVRDSNNKLVFPAGSEVCGKVEELSRGRIYVSEEWKLMTKKRAYRFAAFAGEVYMGSDETTFDAKTFRHGLHLSRNDTLEVGQEFVLTND